MVSVSFTTTQHRNRRRVNGALSLCSSCTLLRWKMLSFSGPSCSLWILRSGFDATAPISLDIFLPAHLINKSTFPSFLSSFRTALFWTAPTPFVLRHGKIFDCFVKAPPQSQILLYGPLGLSSWSLFFSRSDNSSKTSDGLLWHSLVASNVQDPVNGQAVPRSPFKISRKICLHLPDPSGHLSMSWSTFRTYLVNYRMWPMGYLTDD